MLKEKVVHRKVKVSPLPAHFAEKFLELEMNLNEPHVYFDDINE